MKLFFTSIFYTSYDFWISNDAENSALITGINYILQYIHRKQLFKILIICNIINILLYFDQMNAFSKCLKMLKC